MCIFDTFTFCVMPTAIDALLCIAVVVSVVMFIVFYSYKSYRCNSEFAGQMHCVSGIIVCNKPLFGFLMHGVGGMVLLAAGLKVNEKDSPEASLFVLALMYVSLSGVVNFDVRDFKPIHYTSLSGVLGFSVAFVWMQCDATTKIVYTSTSIFFISVIVFNCMFTKWQWPWMDVQALVEIAWIMCLLVCIILFCIPALNPYHDQQQQHSSTKSHTYNTQY